MSPLKRIPSLDGFRALAVLIVFVGHAQLFSMDMEDYGSYWSGEIFVVPAHFGVTLFFFISGYIITTLLRGEFEQTGDISFKRFYQRRIYRIFPPLYIMLAFAAVLTWAGFLRNTATLEATAAQILHMTNYYSLLIGSRHFFQGTSVLWSLAVEEHFYLFFPLLFLVLTRRASNNRVALWLSAICAAVAVWRFNLAFVIEVEGNWSYSSTDARIDSILYGAILAVWRNPAYGEALTSNPHVEKGLVIVALATIPFYSNILPPEWRSTLMYTLQGLAFLPIFSCAILHPDWWCFRWLNWKPIMAIGMISYTFYLMHSILLRVALQLFEADVLAIGFGFAATLGVSALMWRYVEKPLARKRAALHSETKQIGAPVSDLRS